MTKNSIFLLFSLLFFLISCRTAKEDIMVADIDYTILDTLYIEAPKVSKSDTFSLPLYHASATKKWDLIHTDLDLQFDWENELVLGTADITLKPHFYPDSIIVLDAVNFDIHKVSHKGQTLFVNYDNFQLTIPLKGKVPFDEPITLKIEYTAHPGFHNKLPTSKMTSGEKGLYFINAQGLVPSKPRQIWTQGETSYNSRWFPTIDETNQRQSQTTKITVADSLKTLSNGTLLSSVKNVDGTRTDTWSQKLSHAPYLFMVAIGDYAIVKNEWNGIELLYYVEPPFKEDALSIFNHTDEMLSFFSQILKFPYPWDKYAQIVVRDFVAGAMENTSAVTFSEEVQKSKRALIDNNNDAIVAHELFHHWFGNVVTCESWANLTLNEGFANYAEYLWFEHKYGIDRADHHRLQEFNGYLHAVNQQGTHPLIHYHYADKEDMFDAHSYNKGGLVLHMLRHYVGDRAFFSALNSYLVNNQFTEVEADELRIAFEDVSGQDLNWFFNQWYFSEGHPELYVSYRHDSISHTLNIQVEQTQDPDLFPPIFILPTEIAIYDKSGNISYYPITISQRKQTFEFKTKEDFSCAVFDGHKRLLAEVIEDRNSKESEYIFSANKTNYLDRREALLSIASSLRNAHLFERGINDSYYHIRLLALDKHPTISISELKMIAKSDIHSEVRSKAIEKLLINEQFDDRSFFEKIIAEDSAYGPIQLALVGLYNLDKDFAISYAESQIEVAPKELEDVLLEIILSADKTTQLSIIVKKLRELESYSFYTKNDLFLSFFQRQDDEVLIKAAKEYLDIALKSYHPKFHKLLAGQSLMSIKEILEDRGSKTNNIDQINQLIKLLKTSEKDPELLEHYNAF